MTGTRDFLKGLNLDQLLSARSIANELIDEKQREPRVALWCVCDDAVVYGWFREAEYVEAAQCLAATAKDLTDKNYEREELHLERRQVRESELSAYLGDGSG